MQHHLSHVAAKPLARLGVPMAAAAILTQCIFSGFAAAGSLTATPTSLAVTAPAATATLTVSGKGEGKTSGQVRVVRWIQEEGREKLVPTRDVVASPPALRLDPDKNLTVRLVRTSKTPVQGEECYRVLLDQLPGADQDALAVKFALRHSIPLCFDAPKQGKGNVEWSLTREAKSVTLRAANSGGRRIIARNVEISGTGGTVSLPSATVLGQSSMSWPLQGALKKFKPGSAFTLTATVNGAKITFEGRVGG